MASSSFLECGLICFGSFFLFLSIISIILFFCSHLEFMRPIYLLSRLRGDDGMSNWSSNGLDGK